MINLHNILQEKVFLLDRKADGVETELVYHCGAFGKSVLIALTNV